MSSKHTPNYNLSQWEKTDKVLMEDFNADNAKIDAALNSLRSTVGGKASQSALNSLSQTVAGHTAALAGKGDCQLYATSYTGTGTSGSSSRTTLSFPKKPALIVIFYYEQRLILVQGQTTSWCETRTGGTAGVSVSWSGNSVAFYGASPNEQMNVATIPYQVLALLYA